MSSKVSDIKKQFLHKEPEDLGPIERAQLAKKQREQELAASGQLIVQEDADLVDMGYDYDKGPETIRYSEYTSRGQKVKKKAKTAAAVAVAATIAAGGVAASEGNIDMEKVVNPTPIVQDVNEIFAQEDDSEKKAGVNAQTQQTRGQTIAKAIVTPLYAAGVAILELLKGAFAAIGIPILTVFLKWAILAAVILGSLALCFKLAFPDVPLGKILNKKCVGFVLVSVAVGSVVCEILPHFWEGADMWIEIIRIAFGGFVIAPIFITVMKVFGKAKHKLKKVTA